MREKILAFGFWNLECPRLPSNAVGNGGPAEDLSEKATGPFDLQVRLRRAHQLVAYKRLVTPVNYAANLTETDTPAFAQRPTK